MKVELHILQNFSPACLNRDDTNSPKDCEFGGHRRARISSQSLKRAIRWDGTFRDVMAEHLSIRSRQFPSQVAVELSGLGVSNEDAGAVGKALEGIARSASGSGSSTGNNNDDPYYDLNIFKTPQSVFYTRDEVETCALEIQQELDGGTNAAEILRTLRSRRPVFQLPVPRSADIAMFGRMVTSDHFINIDAACQVAHAISTNRVSMETDFFTAIDDIAPEDESGADMMGVIGYNSSCFYRYSLVDMGQLHHNIQDPDLEQRTLEAFIRATVSAIPSGKQNSMAAHNPPDMILAVVRRSGAPVSLANAFLEPVRSQRGLNLMQSSIQAMDSYWGKLAAVYGDDGVVERPICMVEDAEIPFLAGQQKTSLNDLVASVTSAVALSQGVA